MATADRTDTLGAFLNDFARTETSGPGLGTSNYCFPPEPAMGNGGTASQKDAGQPVNAYGFWRIQFLVGSGSDLAIEPTTDGASSSRGVYPWRETGLVTVFVPPTVIRAAGDGGSVYSTQGGCHC